MSLSALLLLIASCFVVWLVLGYLVGKRVGRSLRQRSLEQTVPECDFPFCQCSDILSRTVTKTQLPSFAIKCERAGGIVVATFLEDGTVRHTRPV
jgi:hypothetical protein